MRYTPAQYAEAFLDACRGQSAKKQREITGRFFRMLERSRMLRDAERIVKEIARRERERRGETAAEIRSASPLDPKLRSRIQKSLGKKGAVREALDTGLLAGVRIFINEGLLIDASGFRRLNDLFSKL